MKQQHDPHRHSKGAHDDCRFRSFGNAQKEEADKQHQQLLGVWCKAAAAQPDKADRKGAQENQRRGLRVDVGDKVLQQGIAKQA